MLSIGNQLKAARALAGLDQSTLAKQSGVSVNTIVAMEKKGSATITSGLDTVTRWSPPAGRRSRVHRLRREVHRQMSQSATQLLTMFASIFAVEISLAGADPIPASAVTVLDGDTIALRTRTVRLVGFDAPRAKTRPAASLSALAVRATFRLRQMVAGGGLDLQLVACACRPGTEGTPACNYGRSCGRLTAAGRDVGAVLIGEGLAAIICVVATAARLGGRGVTRETFARTECQS